MVAKNGGRDFDDAFRFFFDRFLEIHPRTTWPRWFKMCTTYGGQREDEKRWRFSFTAVPASVLGPGESWEATKDGGYVLARTDQSTGEIRYVISNAPGDILTIFEAIIDCETKSIEIVVDQDLNCIAGDELLPLQH